MSPTPRSSSPWQHIGDVVIRILGVAAAVAVMGSLARAQNAGDPRFQHLTVEQGLSQSMVYCIFRDSHGYMWFGTRDGLNKYDGYAFTHYHHQPFDSGTIASGVIRSIAEDRTGALWIGTFRGGLVRFDRGAGRFTRYGHDPADPESLGNNDVTIVHIDSQGELWVGTKGTLNRMIPGAGGRPPRFIRSRQGTDEPGALMPGWVIAICDDAEGRLWVATTWGIHCRDRATGRFRTYYVDSLTSPQTQGSIIDMKADRRGNIWFSRGRELVGLDMRSGRISRKAFPAMISAIACDSAGMVWVGAHDGMFTFDPSSGVTTHYRCDPSDPRSLGSNLVLSIYLDPLGRGWIGTDKGLDIIDNRALQFRAYLRHAVGDRPFEKANIRAFMEDSAGIVWIGTAGDGLMSFNRRTGASRRYPPSTPNHSFVNAIHQGPSGTLWIGTRGGLVQIDPVTGAWIKPERPPGISDSVLLNVWAIEQDRYGVYWIGTSLALVMIDPKRHTGRFFVNDPDDPGSLAYNAVWAVHEDRHGDLWVGTPGGLQRFNRATETFTRFQHDPSDRASLGHNEVWSIFEDHAGALWIGTWGGGLNRFDRRRGTFKQYAEAAGLPSNVIHGVTEDEDGFLWVSSGRGLSRFDPRTATVVNFDVNDGLRSDEFNAHAALRTADGEMFFGGFNGLNSFLPGEIRPAMAHNTPIVITSFRKLDSLVATELFDGATVEVLPEENYFAFEFALLDYTSPEKKRYAYKLEGLDRDWVYSGTRRSAAYANLEPGEYLFRVRAASGYGVWNHRELAVTIRVVPAFWQTARFRAMLAVGLAAIGIVWNRRRRRSVREREMALEEAREVERRGIAAELHDGPLQDLYSTRFMLVPLLETLDGGAEGRVAQVEETLKRVRRSLRNVCGTLQLPSFDLGLGAAIEGHAERFREIHPGLRVELELSGEEGALPTMVRENLFRVYRTAISNVVKHANATMVQIRLDVGPRHVLLRVSDNGTGFDPPESFGELLREQHYGLLLAESHMRAIGGRLDIRSAPGRGTTVRAALERRRQPVLRVIEWLRSPAPRSTNINITQSNEN